MSHAAIRPTTTFASPSARVLVTGGTRGVGRGLAERFLAAGARVLVTGRDEDDLSAFASTNPAIATFAGDIGLEDSRYALARHVEAEMPDLNVVVNNAGIQRRTSLATDAAPWRERQAEIDILLAGPVHLNHLLLPTILSHGTPSLVVNVTSGGAYVPQPFAPIYAACKAALHSYTVTLRHALRDTPCRVVELVPPAVATGLAGPGANHGAPLEAFCDAVFPRIADGGGEDVIGYGMTDTADFHAAAQPYRDMFEASAERFPIATFGTGIRQFRE